MEVKRSTASAADLGALGLSRREAEVVFWVAQGKTNREVATILALSPLTVRTHLEHVYKKLGVETRTAATVRALEALGWTGRFQESPWSAR
jgi:DNA-binding CsgD family transcriptional regulator